MGISERLYKDSYESSLVTAVSVKPEGPGGVNSQKKDPGGIDLRALPIITQPMPVPSLGTVPVVFRDSPLGVTSKELGRGQSLSAGTVPVNDKEWQQIENMLNAGITPSVQRIKEYLAACCEKSDFNQQVDKVLSCIADILRMEEDSCCLTDSALRELLILLESGKPVQEIKVALARIEVSPGGARLLQPQ